MSDEMDDIVKEFLVESYENLDKLDRDLVELEKDPSSKEILSSIFRTIHTIKGTCGFLGFSKLESVSHAGENLLSLLREGKLLLNAPITDGLLKTVDAVREMLGLIEKERVEGDKDYSSLISLLRNLQTGTASPAPAAAPAPAVPVVPVQAAPVPEITESEPEKIVTPEPSQKEEVVAIHASPDFQDVDPSADTAAVENRSASVSDSNIRVDVDLLDRLMNLVGELVLARNQILQYNSSEVDPGFQATTQRLNLITSELQEGVMKTRMQPIGNVWSKFPRVVRDLSVGCGKEIQLEMEGKDTELDKTIIEAIKDPLTHLVRNAVDHGIEMPNDRLKKGKKKEGRLFLKAYHEGGKVNIEISDDGGGLSLDRIRKKAVEKGLVNQSQLNRMSEREIMNMVFLPGFSTAEKVTNISGRGVGMDVVKTSIEKIGGTIDIKSIPNEGTTFKIKIPLTLAIIPGLIVTSGGDRYAIPQVSLLELVRLDGEQAKTGVEFIQGSPVYRLRGNLLPLVYLDKELKREKSRGEDQNQNSLIDDAVNIVVLQAEDRQFGLVVESINDTEEIVVKPLSKHFKGIHQFSGATIMGDGKVALILDVLGIAQSAHVVTETKEKALMENQEQAGESADTRKAMLLFNVGNDGRMAIPLAVVDRLEEFEKGRVEKAGGRQVVQYRENIMPLINVAEALKYSSNGNEETSEKLNVVVYSKNGKSYGLVVDQILDVVEETLAIKKDSGRKGLMGSAVIQKKVTDLIDIDQVLVQLGFSEKEESGAAA